MPAPLLPLSPDPRDLVDPGQDPAGLRDEGVEAGQGGRKKKKKSRNQRSGVKSSVRHRLRDAPVDEKSKEEKKESRTGSAHDDGGPAREDNARRRRSSSGARGSRPREVLEFERRGKRVVSDEKEEEKKKRRRKGALSLQALSLSRRKGSIFDLRCPFRALSAELRMPQWMQHIRKRAS